MGKASTLSLGLRPANTRGHGFALPNEAPGVARGLALPSRGFSVIDRVDALDLDRGFIAGTKGVDPAEWFFRALLPGPRDPGSLGLEALMQLLKVYARERFGKLTASHRFQSGAVGVEHRWQYRGQVVPANKEVQVQATNIRVDGTTLVADGQLAADGRVIYSMKNFSVSLVPES